MSSNLEIPLECQDESFGELDEEQKELIKSGALDVVLIENASELVRLVMMDKDHIERLLNAISKSKGCIALPAQTFPLWMDSKISSSIDELVGSGIDVMITYDYPNVAAHKKIYVQRVKQMKEKVDHVKNTIKKGCIFSIFSVHLGDEIGGHWAAFYYDVKNKNVEVFDSMQRSDQGSRFTPFFRQLGIHIFDVNLSKSNINKECFTDILSLQLTGGFSGDDTLMIEKAKRVDSRKKNLLNIQSTESQNHFCYMWALWFLHHKIMELNVMDSAREIYIKRIDPLVVIKRYIWGLFHIEINGKRLVNEIEPKYRKFFKHHFLSVWTNDPDRSFKINYDFNRYTIPAPEAETVDKCLTESMRSERLNKKQKTTSTAAFKKCNIV